MENNFKKSMFAVYYLECTANEDICQTFLVNS
jgi:hypothetical protein